MKFKGADILSTKLFARNDIEKVMRVAGRMEPFASKRKLSDILQGKILAALFYEPSTRTRLSFETAMLRLGGRVITVPAMETSSLTKGETLFDTGKMVQNYADVIAMRHPKEGSVTEMAEGADISVINAGDGPGQHPTQALLDMYTIRKEQGKIDGLTIAMAGDLKFGRTVHSLCYLLAHYKVKLIFVSPKELKMPVNVCEFLKKKGVKFSVESDFDKVIKSGVDVLYCTRIQKERFENEKEYLKLKGVFVLNKKKALTGKKTMTIMHALPRIDEIATDVDSLQNAAYFRQARNGVAVRMALLALVLGKA